MPAQFIWPLLVKASLTLSKTWKLKWLHTIYWAFLNYAPFIVHLMPNTMSSFSPIHLHAASLICYFCIAPLLEIAVWHLLKKCFAKPLKEVWVGVTLSYWKKMLKIYQEKYYNVSLKWEPTPPIFILEYISMVDV